MCFRECYKLHEGMRFVNLAPCVFFSRGGEKSEDRCAARADELSADPLQCAFSLHNLQLMNQGPMHK